MHSRMYMQFLKNIRLRLTDSTKYVKLFSENLCGKQMKQKAETFLRILGIDPGLATMGWGVIEADGYREKLVQYGALITYPRDTFPTRLRCIYTGVQGLLQTFKPDEIAFEELFFSKNVTTGIQVGGARGVALVACQAYTDKLFEYTPMQIKQAAERRLYPRRRRLRRRGQASGSDDGANAAGAQRASPAGRRGRRGGLRHHPRARGRGPRTFQN